MRSNNKSSKSTRHLNLNLLNRKLVISKSKQNFISPRSILKFSQKSLRHAHLRQKVHSDSQEIVVQIENDQILSQMMQFPLKYKVIKHNKQKNYQKKDLIVISKIQEFYLQYNSLFNSLQSKFQNIQWLIISNAINNQETQKQWNQNYQPVKFTFLKGSVQVVNHINFKDTCFVKEFKKLDFFGKIINFGHYKNDLASILEFNESYIKKGPQQQNEMWIMAQQTLSLLQTSKYDCYFLSETLIKTGKIQVLTSSSKNIVYILYQNYDICLQLLGIKQLQQHIDASLLKNMLIVPQEKRYYQKVIQCFLLHQNVYNLINFPIQAILQFSNSVDYVITSNKMLKIPQSHLYSVYYGQKNEDDILGISFNSSTRMVEKEITKIKLHFQNLAKIQDQYQQIKSQLHQFVFLSHMFDKHGVAKQIEYFTGKSILQVNSLEGSQFQNMKVIVIGNFNNQDYLFLDKRKNIFRIHADLNWSQSSAIHNQIFNIVLKLNQYKEVESIIQSKAISFADNFNNMNISKQLYISYHISQFDNALECIQEDSSHILIMEMDQYNENREQRLKNIELAKNVIFQVYLCYGNQFIFRNTNSKYKFLKKDQLMERINQIQLKNQKNIRKMVLEDQNPFEYSLKSDFSYKINSDIRYNHTNHFKNSTNSTPHLNYYTPTNKQILICIPKTIPYHSLINRSTYQYTLLIYSSLQQIHQLIKYITNDYFAIIITASVQNICNDNLNQVNYQFKEVKQFSQKLIREEIDLIVDRFGLVKKNGGICKYKKGLPIVVLYDYSDPKQVKSIQKMNQIFKNSKVMTISKKEFKNLKKSYQISDKIAFYEMGKHEIAFAKRIKCLVDLFKVYMLPNLSAHQFTAQKLRFSPKQLFLRAYFERRKKDKFKSRFQELTLTRSLSPKSRSIMQKECFLSEHEMTIVQSDGINKLVKRQKFSSSKELIQICLNNLAKGNQILAVVSEKELFDIKHEVNVYSLEITWLVVVEDIKKCIIRECNMVFCQPHQLEYTMTMVIQMYKQEKQKVFKIIQKEKWRQQNQASNIETSSKRQFFNILITDMLNADPKPSSQLQIYFDKSLRQVPFQSLNNTLIVNNDQLFHSMTGLTNQLRLSNLITEQNETIFIVSHLHNKKFMDQSLAILDQKSTILIYFQSIGDLVSYSQIGKSMFIIEKEQNLKGSNILIVQPHEAAHTFSKRLKVFLEAFRKSN